MRSKASLCLKWIRCTGQFGVDFTGHMESLYIMLPGAYLLRVVPYVSPVDVLSSPGLRPTHVLKYELYNVPVL